MKPLRPSTGTAQSLAGKAALITGGSRGIGRAIVERFQREGARVATVSRSTTSAVSGEVFSLAGDVSSEDDVVNVMHEVERALGRLDVLVNNAAVELEARLEETSVTQWDHVMAVNVRGVFLCTKHALPLLRRAGGGSIINVSSVDGFWAEPGLAAYNASKGAVLALTRAIAIDHGPEGIRCNSICPATWSPTCWSSSSTVSPTRRMPGHGRHRHTRCAGCQRRARWRTLPCGWRLRSRRSRRDRLSCSMEGSQPAARSTCLDPAWRSLAMTQRAAGPAGGECEASVS